MRNYLSGEGVSLPRGPGFWHSQYKQAKETFICRSFAECIFSVFIPRSIMWWFSTRHEWNRWESWLSSRLSQLCQLHMDHSDGRKKQDTAVLPHLCSGGRLWHRLHLWWAATASQLKNEVGVACSLVRWALLGWVAVVMVKKDTYDKC